METSLSTEKGRTDTEASKNAHKDVKWGDLADEETSSVSEDFQKLEAIPRVEPQDEDSPLPHLEKKLSSSSGMHIIVEQQDPNSPLFSVKSFEELPLSEPLKKGIYSMGFNKPSKIQEIALPKLLANPPRNMIAQAQSGTGKTAAFVLTMLTRVDANIPMPQGICISPTRELARQLYDNVLRMAKFTSIKTMLIVKDVEMPKKINAHILVGTPGKLLDAVEKLRCFDPSKIRIFVFDEADTMLDQEQSLQEQALKLKKYVSPRCQFLLFSATYRPDVIKFAQRTIANPDVIRLQRKDLTLKGIQQLYIDCLSEENKFNVLSDIYAYLTVGQSIIFVHTRAKGKDLKDKMIKAGHTVSLIHGGEQMTSEERDRVIDDFRSAKTKVLIATNVIARGIDVLQVMLVINYDLPLDRNDKPDPETYLHRIGRSGRFGRRGIAINFVHNERTKKDLQFIARELDTTIEGFSKDQIESLQGKLEKIYEEDLKEMVEKGGNENSKKLAEQEDDIVVVVTNNKREVHTETGTK